MRKRERARCLESWILGVMLIGLFAGHAVSQPISLGFIGDEATFQNHNVAALEWARANFDTTVIKPNELPTANLSRYAVLWWQEGENDPTPLFTDDVKKALLDYLRSGGSLLLSAAAEQLATSLGVESGNPRMYGPGNDAQKAGVTIREDTVDHPVWEGFNREAGEKIEVTTVGFPKSSDYWSRQFVDAVTIGDCWEAGTDWTDEVGAFVEWREGNGLVFGIGWRLPHWTDDNGSRATLEKLTANVLRYLAEESAFFAVQSRGKVAVVWGRIKTP